MIVKFVPHFKMIEGVTAAEVAQNEIGKPIEITLELVHLTELVTGDIRVSWGRMVYLTDEVKITKG